MKRTWVLGLAALCFSACGGTLGPSTAKVAEPAVAVSASAPAAAEPDRTKPPAPGTARPFALPAEQRLTLPNGLEVVLIPRAGVPSLAMRLSIRAGRDASSDNVALPELTARLLRDGTRTQDATEIAEFADRNGLAVDAGAEANRVLLSADGLTQNAEAMLSVLRVMAQEATFPQDRVEARKKEFEGELELQASEPDFHLQRLTYKVLFGNHPYAAVLPTAADIAKVDRKAIERFYKQNYGPKRARLVVVGQIPEGFEAQLRAALATWRSSASTWKPAEAPRIEVCNEAFVVLRPDSVQTSINWVGPGVRQADPDYFNTLLANQVLGGNAGARLFMNLRESKSYTYGAYSRLSQIYGGAWFTAFSNVRGPVTEGALTEFRNEFARMAEGTIEEKELAGAVDYLAGIFPIQIEENGPLADVVLRTLDQGLQVDYLKSYRDRVRGVTRAQAEQAARRNMSGTALSLIMVGTEEQTVANAKAQSSKVNIYDLDGKKVREEAGNLARLCTGR